MITSNKCQAAMDYAERGLAIIPCGPNKRPLIDSWAKYQKEAPSKDQVLAWWDRFPDANPAILTGAASGVCVVDIDDMRTGPRALAPFISPVVRTPTAKTAHGGLHLYFAYQPGLRNNARAIEGCDFRGEGGYVLAPPSFVSDDKGSGGYEWVTDFSTPLAPLPAAYIERVQDLRLPSPAAGRTAPEGEALMFQEGRRDEDLFSVANALVKGGLGEQQIRAVLEILGQACTPPFPERDLPAKIQSALQRAARRESSIAGEVFDWILLQAGYWSVTDVYTALHAVTSGEKGSIRQAIHRLYRDGILERYGRKGGQYRRIDKENSLPMDWKAAPTAPLPIRFPLGIHELALIYAKSIVVIEGVMNCGKSVFCLETALMNRHLFPTRPRYLSSEMGPTELKTRLLLYEKEREVPLAAWDGVEFIERTSDWADLIDGDPRLYLIDYVELYTDAWRIAEVISGIFAKLQAGVCVVALQRDPAKAYAWGGQASRHKSRLTVVLDNGRAKIEKAKAFPPDGENPNGFERPFKILRGCRFVAPEGWAPPVGKEEKPLDKKKTGRTYRQFLPED